MVFFEIEYLPLYTGISLPFMCQVWCIGIRRIITDAPMTIDTTFRLIKLTSNNQSCRIDLWNRLFWPRSRRMILR